MKLTPLKKPPPQKPFAVCDIETKNWTEFIMIGHYEIESASWFEFKKMADYIEFLSLEQRCETIFAHFGGKFDFLFILETLLQTPGVTIAPIVPRGSSILYIECYINDFKYVFRDSSALLPFGLKSLAENFDVPTKKKELDHSKTKGYSKELAEYCKDDCIALAQCLQKYFEWPLIKKAGAATTMASQSLRVLRTMISSEIPGLGKHGSDFVRNSYLGGRTEIFNPLCSKGPLYEYDVNSLYPFVMRDNYFPIGNGYFTYNFESNRLGVYRARVTAPKSTYLPCLGIVRNNKYIFPIGTFEGHWTSEEIKLAKSEGYKIEILKGYVWSKKTKIFKKYVDTLYDIKEHSPPNSVSYILAKLLMNSCYGRFGMNLEKENITFDLSEGVKFYETIQLANKQIDLFKEKVDLRSFTHNGIASFVTSYSRIHMFKLFKPLGKHLYYTDTDSIFTTIEMPTSSALGALKLESIYDSAVFLLPKTYHARSISKNKIAMKGFDKKKIINFTHEDFQSALEGDLSRMKITNEPKFASFKTALAQKKIVTMTKGGEKQLRSMYDKRIILKDSQGNYSTKPITYYEG